MRNGSGPKSARGGRMLNNLNKQMDNNDAALHRVRGSQGSGRINSHSREPPKGPRGANVGRGVAAMANGRGLGNVGMNMGPGGANGMNGMGMNQMGGMPPMPNAANGPELGTWHAESSAADGTHANVRTTSADDAANLLWPDTAAFCQSQLPAESK